MTNENSSLSIGDTAGILMGAGIAKLDDLYVGLGLIAAGVVLRIIVAFLQRSGLDVRKGPVG